MEVDSSVSDRLNPRVVKALLTLTVVQCCVSEVLHAQGIGPSLLKSMWTVCLGNAFFCHLVLGFYLYWLRHFGVRRSTGYLAAVTLVGVLAEAGLYLLRGDEPTLFRIILSGAGLGAAGLLAFLLELRDAQVRRRHGLCFLALCLLPLSCFSGGWLVNSAARTSPMVYDLHLHAADLTLYRPLSAWMCLNIGSGQLAFFQVVYELLGLLMVLVEVEFLSQPGKFRQNPLILFYLQGAFAVVFYYLLPGVGSSFVFQYFPALVPMRNFAIEPFAWAGLQPRNCFPSMHVCWMFSAVSLLVAGTPRLRPLLALFLAATLVSVFCVGNHYIVDVLASFPMAAASHALCSAALTSDSVRRSKAFWGLVILALLFLELFLLRDYAWLWYQRRWLLWSVFGSVLALSVAVDRHFFWGARPAP